MTEIKTRTLHLTRWLTPRCIKAISLLIACIVVLTGCATQDTRSSKDTVVIESANQDTRVRIVVIHHTTGNFQGSLDILTKDSGNPVSSHYLIPEPGDASYTGKKLKLYSLVPEEGRAWHAGRSYWAGKTSLNDMSVGIELVNQTYCRNTEQPVQPEQADQEPARICFYPDFADSQLEILTDLLEDILSRHTEVKPTDIIGHSDIAPQRKIDPGPRFPWQRLYRLGYGAWFDDDTVFKYWEQFRLELPPVLTLQTALHSYGYDIELSGEHDQQSRNVVRAFQMHFLPWQVSSEFNDETVAVLYALLEKYRPEKLELLSSASSTETDNE
ncbi:MAG: N-acetylmuramoyl-L-alanine amidase [Xanthomonadales bacterium]|nr:N-acetylmuramoyl-L-alanine amidase [Xanthomonadales bacterium]MDH4018595.1 N-acetylmuramoyl-L-alanine amidase [Xanthomonadales bacterium]